MNPFFSRFINRAIAAEQIRAPRFAGTWYPADGDNLNQMLSEYLREAHSQLSSQAQLANKNVLAIIAPHAGYLYSGKTAAFAYTVLSHSKCKRIFLLAPSHHAAFSGAVLPSQKAFETPLGNIDLDRETIEKLLSLSGFQQGDQVFDIEHSVELQLPWIYKTLNQVKLVPMAIGNIDNETLNEIASAIKKELRPGDAIIVSSDFTHYGPRFDYEPFSDEATASERKNKIAQLDQEAFACLKKLDSSELLNFYRRTHDTICGIYPCAILLSLLPADTKAQLLNYRTSADSGQDEGENSVSYMAIAFTGSRWEKQKKSINVKDKKSIELSESDGQALLKIARQAISDYLANNRKDPSAYAQGMKPQQIDLFSQQHGVFVTLYKKSSIEQTDSHQRRELRGCIGYIYPVKSLLVGVCDNAINAASNDPRFSPVTANELDNLDFEINVLTKPVPISSWQEIKLGQDGIVLKKSGRQAVFLPQVAPEFGWDLPQTLAQLSVKAGLPPDAWRQDAEFEVFQSLIFDERDHK